MWIMVLYMVWNNVYMSWFSPASTVVAANFSSSVADLVQNLPEPPPKSSQCKCFMLKRQICVWFSTISFLVLTLCCPFFRDQISSPFLWLCCSCLHTQVPAKPRPNAATSLKSSVSCPKTSIHVYMPDRHPPFLLTVTGWWPSPRTPLPPPFFLSAV